MRRIEALVAEHAAELEDPLEAADHEPLERQLERDPQDHVGIERVVMGDERPRGRAARGGLQHRRLDLGEAAFDERRAHGGDDCRADVEGVPRRRIGDQVEVALAQPCLGVGQAAMLVGQRMQRLRQQLHLSRGDGQLARVRGHHRAGDADPVAAVERLDVLEPLTQRIARDEQLHAPALVGQGAEEQAAVAADQHQPAGDTHAVAGRGVRFQAGEAPAQVGRGVIALERGRVRLDPALAQRFELREPLLALALVCFERAHDRTSDGRPATRSPMRRRRRSAGRSAAKRAAARSRLVVS